MKKIVKIDKNDLNRIVKKVIKEELGGERGMHPTFGDLNLSQHSTEELGNMTRDDESPNQVTDIGTIFTIEDMVGAYDDGFKSKKYTSAKWERQDRDEWIEKLSN